MLIGIPKEIKANEHRVGLTPSSVKELIHYGHKVIIETQAGSGINQTDDDYRLAGARIVLSANDIYTQADMVVKVKEPQVSEYQQLRPDQILFTYLHLSPDKAQTQGLIDSGCIAVAYETVTSEQGGLPLLAPMSEVAGRMATQVGAYHLLKQNQGMGILLGGVAGLEAGKVVVLGGGVAGLNATQMAVGLGADVVVIDKNISRLRYLDNLFQGRIKTVYSTMDAVEKHCISADLVIGTVLIPGANAPKLITKDILKQMKAGAVVVDVAIDQGGCTEVSKATTHAQPTFIYDDVIIYCVANMPGSAPATATYALNHATLPFVLQIANKGIKQALIDNMHLRNGLNICKGKVTCQSVAQAQQLTYVPAMEALQSVS